MAHCLIVDDSRVIRAVARRILEELNFVVTEAEDGMTSLRACREKMPDLILLDWSMPGMSGVELVRAARLGRPELPVLFVTGFGGSALPEGEEAPGEVLHKPFRTAELAERVATVLGRHPPLRR